MAGSGGLITLSPRRARIPTIHHYPRAARVNEVVRETLADELERLSDPRLGFVTLTGVAMSADLRVANVFYSVLGTSDEVALSSDALASAAPHLRTMLGHAVRLKYVPELRFRVDPAVVEGTRVDEVIRRLHASGDADARS